MDKTEGVIVMGEHSGYVTKLRLTSQSLTIEDGGGQVLAVLNPERLPSLIRAVEALGHEMRRRQERTR